MNKKAQAQIITTVLIIVLVLAAIVILWQVIQGTVERGTEQVAGQSDCLTLKLKIESLSVSMAVDDPITDVDETEGIIRIKRNVGKSDLKKLRILIDDEIEGDDIDISELKELAIKEIRVDRLDSDQTVKIAAIIGVEGSDDRLCDIVDTKKAS